MITTTHASVQVTEQQVADGMRSGIERAAQFIEKKRDSYVGEHGIYDHETGAMEFPGDGLEYFTTLNELADDIRALAGTLVPIVFTNSGEEPDYSDLDCPHCHGSGHKGDIAASAADTPNANSRLAGQAVTDEQIVKIAAASGVFCTIPQAVAFGRALLAAAAPNLSNLSISSIDAAAIRNAALEEAATICENDCTGHRHTTGDSVRRHLAVLVRASKSAPPGFPRRDDSKPAEQQGLFNKFNVRRVDGSDAPGGKHHGCRYFVLDIDHDPAAGPALSAYVDAVKATHPLLAVDLLSVAPAQDEEAKAVVRGELEEAWLDREFATGFRAGWNAGIEGNEELLKSMDGRTMAALSVIGKHRRALPVAATKEGAQP